MNKADEVKERVICCDCGTPFDVTFGEAEWYLSKSLSIPKRCKACRMELRLKQRADRERREEVQRG